MISELSPELAKIAKDELNENPKQTKEDLDNLKDWISKQPHLKARTNDQWLIAMLRGCKFSLEKVKKKLDLYYTLRTTAPDITLRIKPTDPKFLDFFRLGTCVILPKPKNKLFPRVLLIRAGVYDPSRHNVADVMCILYYLVQIAIIDDEVASVLGTKIMVDYEGVTMNHFVQATPTIIKKMVAVCQEARQTLSCPDNKTIYVHEMLKDSMPLRLKGSHHINVPSGIEKIFTLISGFLNEKAKQRLKIYKNTEDLAQDIPKEIIPTEYGGDGGTVNEIIEYWISKIVEYKDWLREEEQFGTDESKRPGQPVTQEMMGIDGSFRKLDID